MTDPTSEKAEVPIIDTAAQCEMVQILPNEYAWNAIPASQAEYAAGRLLSALSPSALARALEPYLPKPSVELPGHLNCPSCKAADIVSQPDRGGRSYSCPVCSRSVPLESVALRWHGELTSARAEVERLTKELIAARSDVARTRAFLRRIPIVRRANEAPFSTCLGCGATDGDGCKPRCWVHELDGLADTTPVGQGADHGVVAVAFLVRYGAMSDEALADLEDLLIDAYVAGAADPVESWRSIPPHDLVLHCPNCGKQHLDIGEFATRVHRKHKCENTPEGERTGCGHLWTPFPYATRGVERLRADVVQDEANNYYRNYTAEFRRAEEERARREAAEQKLALTDEALTAALKSLHLALAGLKTLANPVEAVERCEESLHPTGRCECGGAGDCKWCRSICPRCGGGGETLDACGSCRSRCIDCLGTGRRPPEPPAVDDDKKPREPGCRCHWEEGDSPCPVHGEEQEPTPAPASKADDGIGADPFEAGYSVAEQMQKLRESQSTARALIEKARKFRARYYPGSIEAESFEELEAELAKLAGGG